MDILVLLGLWLCTLLVTIFVLLFGQNAAFAHTPLPRLHWLVTQGLCHAVRWVLGVVSFWAALLWRAADC